MTASGVPVASPLPAPGTPSAAGAAGLRAPEPFASDLWDAARSQRPEWAAMLAEARALSEGAPAPVHALADDAVQALLRGRAIGSVAGRSKASRFLVFLSSTFVGE